MKRQFLSKVFILMCLMFVSNLSTISAQTESIDKVEVEFPRKFIYATTDNVNLRIAPSSKAEKFYDYGEAMQLPSYTLFQVLQETRNGWFEIKWNIANTVFVSKTVVKEANLTPLSMDELTNKRKYADAKGQYWYQIGEPKELPGTVLWVKNECEEGTYSLTLGKKNSAGTLIGGFLNVTVGLKYVPKAKVFVKSITDQNSFGSFTIIYGDEYSVTINGQKMPDLTKFPKDALKKLFENDQVSCSSEFLSNDVLL